MMNMLIPLIMAGVGTGVSAAGQASAQNSAEQMSREGLQWQRDQAAARQGPSKQMMKLSELLTQNYNPVSYTPGQGYSQPSSFNMQNILQGLQPVVDQDAQDQNSADWRTAQARMMFGPPAREADRSAWMKGDGTKAPFLRSGDRERQPGAATPRPTRGLAERLSY